MKAHSIFPRVSATLALLLAVPGTVDAGYALFDAPTDTISIAGNTILGTTATYEAVIRFASIPASGSSIIWNEFKDSAEDKQLGIYSDGSIYGYSYNASLVNQPLSGGVLTPGTWRHVAYVYDGASERLYIDGILVNSKIETGEIGDGAPSQMVIGAALFRNPSYVSFLGDIDSLRISNTARYSGASFVPVIGDLSNDASTLLLYNFNQAPGTTSITDESGNGAVGTLGVGFPGATSPTFDAGSSEAPVVVIEPAVALSWQSVTGVIYQPQVSPSLAPAEWTNFGAPLVGTGAVMQIFNVNGGAPRKFYRLIFPVAP